MTASAKEGPDGNRIEAAWIAEAVRRADEIKRGEAEALDGGSVLANLKAKFPALSPPARG